MGCHKRPLFSPWIDPLIMAAYLTPILKKYTVSTLHDDPRLGDVFVLGFQIEAANPTEAAQKRFQQLAEEERELCLALLVKPEDGRATVVPVKKTKTPKVTTETTYKVGI